MSFICSLFVSLRLSCFCCVPPFFSSDTETPCFPSDTETRSVRARLRSRKRQHRGVHHLLPLSLLALGLRLRGPPLPRGGQTTHQHIPCEHHGAVPSLGICFRREGGQKSELARLKRSHGAMKSFLRMAFLEFA